MLIKLEFIKPKPIKLRELLGVLTAIFGICIVIVAKQDLFAQDVLNSACVIFSLNFLLWAYLRYRDWKEGDRPFVTDVGATVLGLVVICVVFVSIHHVVYMLAHKELSISISSNISIFLSLIAVAGYLWGYKAKGRVVSLVLALILVLVAICISLLF